MFNNKRSDRLNGESVYLYDVRLERGLCTRFDSSNAEDRKKRAL